MSRFRLNYLTQRCIEGNLAESERAELRETLRERFRSHFDICPACGGAFSTALRFDGPIHCPNCQVSLTCWSSDVSGHHTDEVDPSLPKMQLFGVFETGYSIPGVQPCLECGILYPRAYTCCPRLFCTAAEYFATGDTQRAAAVLFVNNHCETLLNVLRSRFLELFTRQHLKLLNQFVPFAERGLEIGSLLDSITEKKYR